MFAFRHFNFFRSPEAEELLLKNDAKLLRHLLDKREPEVAESYVADLTRPGRLTGGVVPNMKFYVFAARILIFGLFSVNGPLLLIVVVASDYHPC